MVGICERDDQDEEICGVIGKRDESKIEAPEIWLTGDNAEGGQDVLKSVMKERTIQRLIKRLKKSIGHIVRNNS